MGLRLDELSAASSWARSRATCWAQSHVSSLGPCTEFPHHALGPPLDWPHALVQSSAWCHVTWSRIASLDQWQKTGCTISCSISSEWKGDVCICQPQDSSVPSQAQEQLVLKHMQCLLPALAFLFQKLTVCLCYHSHVVCCTWII